MDEADSEVGADDVSVFANEGGAVVGVELVGEASAANGFFEGVVEALRVFASGSSNSSRVAGGVRSRLGTCLVAWCWCCCVGGCGSRFGSSLRVWH